MPRKCCVPGCRSNYKSTRKYVTTFLFPKDDIMREKWLQALPRKYWIPSAFSGICCEHFHPNDVKKTYKLQDAAGNTIDAPLKQPKLSVGAVPCIFNVLPENERSHQLPNQTNSFIGKEKIEECREEIKVIESKSEPVILNCDLCGIFSNELHDLSKNDLSKKVQWITREESKSDTIKINTACENCFKKLCFLVDSIAEIWTMFLHTQKIMKNNKDFAEQTESMISDELIKHKIFFKCESQLVKSSKDSLKINNANTASICLKKEIEASIFEEGCTNLEWLQDTESSDATKESQHINSSTLGSDQNVSITRTNNRGLTYKSNSLNFIVKKPHGVFECTVCHEAFVHRYNAEHHVRSQHTNEKPFCCPICSKSFMVAYYLNRHISCVHEKGKFICEKCGKRFQKRYLLSAHEQIHEGRTISCPYDKCSKLFYSNLILKMHITNTHSGLNFICEHCGKVFRTKIRLMNHIQRHGDKKLKCPHCPKMFYIKTDRLLHLKYHRDNLPWRCKKCNMYFKTTRGLQNHLSVAHGEKVSKVDLYKQNTTKSIK